MVQNHRNDVIIESLDYEFKAELNPENPMKWAKTIVGSIGLGVPGAEVHGIYSKTVLDKEFNVYSVFDEIVENMEGK